MNSDYVVKKAGKVVAEQNGTLSRSEWTMAQGAIVEDCGVGFREITGVENSQGKSGHKGTIVLICMLRQASDYFPKS